MMLGDVLNAVAPLGHDPDMPRSWRWWLLAMEAGKGAVGGVGLFIAFAGLENLFILVTTGEVTHPNIFTLNVMSIIGALIGAIYALLRPLIRSASHLNAHI